MQLELGKIYKNGFGENIKIIGPHKFPALLDNLNFWQGKLVDNLNFSQGKLVLPSNLYRGEFQGNLTFLFESNGEFIRYESNSPSFNAPKARYNLIVQD